ncbi:Protein of unknown function [Pseudomonas flavescens]|uniref:DUF1097 domain-containing protein n=1 Tax=Phytopseudomonas flavescens TaxID=29435 RepID=A0A1G7X8F5_9GAMM|nr:DUF1097 domain-containing protein [Pseudomonas flavescens]SDG80468.1 Protein of unknown function [Pseudomonas flavescens]
MSFEALGKHLKIVFGESLVAASAATFSVLVLEMPVWAMFIGWIAFFTRGLNLHSGLINLGCVLIGLLLGMLAARTHAALEPLLGAYTITLVVTIITVIALSLARLPVFNNLLGFFLGLAAFFASQLPPTVGTFAALGLVTGVGSSAGFLAISWQRRVNRGPARAGS